MNFWRSFLAVPSAAAGRVAVALSLVFALMVVLASCSGSFSIGGQTVEEAAVELIEGELSEIVGLTFVADCPEVVDPEVGTEFSCTAATDRGAIAHFDVLVDREDHIDVQTTNLVSVEAFPKFESVISDGIAEESGGAQVVVDCGEEAIIADAADSFSCALTGDGADPEASVVVTVTDFDDGTIEYETTDFTYFVPELLAVDLIEGELASGLGIEMAATCPTEIDTTVGTEFTCTGETPDGHVVQIAGLVDEPDHIDLNTTNLLRGDVMVRLEDAAAAVLEPETGPVVLDCGREAVVLDADSKMRCDIASADGTETAIAVLTITDLDTGDFTIDIE